MIDLLTNNNLNMIIKEYTGKVESFDGHDQKSWYQKNPRITCSFPNSVWQEVRKISEKYGYPSIGKFMRGLLQQVIEDENSNK